MNTPPECELSSQAPESACELSSAGVNWAERNSCRVNENLAEPIKEEPELPHARTRSKTKTARLTSPTHRRRPRGPHDQTPQRPHQPMLSPKRTPVAPSGARPVGWRSRPVPTGWSTRPHRSGHGRSPPGTGESHDGARVMRTCASAIVHLGAI